MFHKILPTLLSLGFLTFLSGCNSLQDHCNQALFSANTHCEAKRCWREMKDCYSEVCYPLHFKTGFVQGYQDVANGGNGCPPLMPPRHYWKPCFMNPEGHCKTIEWFNGYSHGALAAQQSNAGKYGEIPISPYMNGGIPAGAEHNIQYPQQSNHSDFESLNGDSANAPKNADILLPPMPDMKKNYE